MKATIVLTNSLILFHVAVGQTIIWQPAGTLTEGDVRSVLGTPWGYVFAGMASNPGGLMISTDNGQSWQPDSSGFIDQVNTLAAKQIDTIFGGLSIFGVVRSTDSGYNWSIVGLVETEVFALGISREQKIFAGTWLEGVYRSDNNGDTWVSANSGLPLNSEFPVRDFAFDSSGTVFASPQGAGGAGIYYSTNNGDLWQSFGAPTTVVQCLAVHDGGAIFAGSGDGIFRTTDQGSSWTEDTIGNVTSLLINTSGHIFAGTFGNGVLRSTNVGDTWVPLNSGLTNLNIQCLTMTPQGYVFIGTAGAGVFRTVQSTNSAPESDWPIPKDYSLKQNYPNPFNPSTTINFVVPMMSHVKLIVYDVLGQQVATLVDGNKEAGSHSTLLNAQSLTSGVYFYRLEADGSVITKRMIILK